MSFNHLLKDMFTPSSAVEKTELQESPAIYLLKKFNLNKDAVLTIIKGILNAEYGVDRRISAFESITGLSINVNSRRCGLGVSAKDFNYKLHGLFKQVLNCNIYEELGVFDNPVKNFEIITGQTIQEFKNENGDTGREEIAQINKETDELKQLEAWKQYLSSCSYLSFGHGYCGHLKAVLDACFGDRNRYSNPFVEQLFSAYCA